MPLSSPGNRRLAVAGVVLALLAFGVFFAVGRSGREPTTTTAVQSAAGAEVGDAAPAVGAVTGTSGAIPSLKPPPDTSGTGEPATGTTSATSSTTTGPTATGPTAATTATTGPTTSSTTGPPPTTGTTTGTTTTN